MREFQVIVHTPFKDYIAPDWVLDAAGYGVDKESSVNKRLHAWADWMQYCEFDVKPAACGGWK